MAYVEPRTVTDLSSCVFYHTMDLPGYGIQEGPWDLRGRFSDYIGNVSCAGKRLLDVGCASGFLSFSAEEEGAREVVSFDMDRGERQHLLPFHEKEYYRDHAAWEVKQSAYITRWHNAYWLSHRVKGSKARVVHGDIYDITADIGTFDIVLVCAVLEHLSDPIRALASVARRCSQTLVISTELLNTEEPTARFSGNAGRPDVDYVFWVYSLGVYRHVLKMLGFDIVRVVTKKFRYTHLSGDYPRTAIVAQRTAG